MITNNVKNELNNNTDTSDLWIVPYADFMTVLMIFFLLMYAFAFNSKTDRRFEKIVATIQQEMGGNIDKELIEKMVEQEKTEQIISKFDDMIKNLNLKNYITLTTNSEQIKVILANPVLFDSGKTELKPKSKEILHEIVNIMLKDIQNEIIIEGHTDDRPIRSGKFKSNWELSVARAIEVINFLTKNENLNPKRFAAAGYGEYRPLYPNDTPENRAKNRRIEINILRH